MAQNPSPLPQNNRPTPFVTGKDSDRDGTPDTEDKCPDTPAKNAPDGCPQINLFSGSTRSAGVYFQPTSYFSLRVLEKTQIQNGDIFKAAIIEPVFDEIITESNLVQVID